MTNVALNLETVEVSEAVAAQVARIADLNEVVRLAEAEGKALKAEVVEAVGGVDMAVLFPEGVRVTHDGTALATVKAQTRTTISTDALTDAVEAVLAAFPALAEDYAEAVEALRNLPVAAAKVSTYAVVRTR